MMKLLSSIAFNINLRRYKKDPENEQTRGFTMQADISVAYTTSAFALDAKVERCRLTISKPVLKAPLVSALATKT
jgi:hypothetical protein